MTQEKTSTATIEDASAKGAVQAFHGVRYQVTDVARSVAFYTKQLGFTLEHQQLPAFASVSLGNRRSFSAVLERLARAPCLMVVRNRQAAGTASSLR